MVAWGAVGQPTLCMTCWLSLSVSALASCAPESGSRVGGKGNSEQQQVQGRRNCVYMNLCNSGSTAVTAAGRSVGATVQFSHADSRRRRRGVGNRRREHTGATSGSTSALPQNAAETCAAGECTFAPLIVGHMRALGAVQAHAVRKQGMVCQEESRRRW